MVSVAALLLAGPVHGDPAWFGAWQVYEECRSPGRLVTRGCTPTMSQEREDVKVTLEDSVDMVRLDIGFTGRAREPAPHMRVTVDRRAWGVFSREERLDLLRVSLRSWIAAADRGGCRERCPQLGQFEDGLEAALDKFSSSGKF